MSTLDSFSLWTDRLVFEQIFFYVQHCTFRVQAGFQHRTMTFKLFLIVYLRLYSLSATLDHNYSG